MISTPEQKRLSIAILFLCLVLVVALAVLQPTIAWNVVLGVLFLVAVLGLRYRTIRALRRNDT